MPKKKQSVSSTPAPEAVPGSNPPTGEVKIDIGLIEPQASVSLPAIGLLAPDQLLTKFQNIASAAGYPEILDEIVHCQAELLVEKADLILINPDPAETFYRYLLVSSWTPEKGAVEVPAGTHLPFATYNAYFDTPQPLFSQNTASDPSLDENARQVLGMDGEAVSIGIIPLHSGERQVGVIVLTSTHEGAFSKEALIVLPLLAAPTALTIERLQLARRAAAEKTEKENLAAVTAALAAAGSYAAILDAVRQHTFLGSDAIRIELGIFNTPWTDQETPEWLEVRSSWNEAGEPDRGKRLLLNEIPGVKKVLLPDSPALMMDNSAAAPDIRKFLQKNDAQRCIWLPLVAAGRWFGMIWAMQSTARQLSDPEMNLAMAAAHQAALAAENIDSRAAALQSSQNAAVLFQASQLLATAGSEKEIFQITLQAAMQALDIQSAYIHVSAIDQDKPVMRQAACLAGERVPLQRDGSVFPARLFPYYDLFMAGQSTSTVNTQGDDRLTDTARRYFQLLQGVAVAEVPLPVRGQTYGVLLAVRSQSEPFTASELVFLESLSGQAGTALENFRLLLETRSAAREAHERTLELSLINRVVSSVSSSRDLKSGLQAVVDELVESFALASSGIALLNDDCTYLEIAAERHRDGTPTSNTQIPVKGNPSTLRVMETRKPLVIADAQHNPLTAPIHSLMVRRGIQTLVLLPLIVNNEVIGTVGMDIQEAERTLTKDEIRLAETIVFQAAVVIQNARLLDQTQRALSETELLYRISQSVASASTTAELARLVIDNALPAAADQLIFMFYQPVLAGEGREIEIAGRCARSAEYIPDGTRFPQADLPLLDQIGSNPFVIKDYKTADLDTRSIETLIRLEIISGCILPLRTAGQQIGFMIVSSPQVAQYTPAEIRSLQLTADGIAVALEKQRLLLQAQRRAVELQTAALVARETSSTLDLDVLLKRMVNVLCERFGFYHASVFLLDEDREFAVVRESTGLAGEEMKVRGHKLAVGSRSIIGSVTATGNPLVVNDVSHSETHRKNPLLPNTRSELGIPLKLGERIIGALDVQSTQVNAFHPDDVAVLQILADQIAVAIENAKAYTLSLQAVDDMREADKMKSKFLANMSHELRTPLNSIIGFSRVILKGIDGPVTDIQQQDLTAIYNSGQHLLRLINDILDVSKIEAGKMELSFNDVNIQELVNSVMSTATGLIKDKQIKINRSIPNDLPLVRGDSVRLRQVLINLISNAAKFTDHGTITIDASQQAGPNATAEVIIRVMDTGQGIAPEHQRKLFLPFSQVDDSPTRKTGGTGLGLSISKSLMDMHGGRIGLEKSRVGEGSTFFFTMPVSGSVPLAAASSGPSMSILAIDPDPRVIRLYQSHLEPQGYQVVPLVDASIAGYHAQRLKPLAVILDVTPRDHSGWKAVKQLRSDPETSAVPMVLCSLIQEEEIGFCLGITEFLNKPLKSEVLSAALARLGLNVKFRELLIVDDNVDDLKAIQQSFEDSPNTFLTFAKDAWQARALLSKRKPSAVIMDLIKPDLYRLDLIKELRANPEYGNIPLIFLIGMDRLQENIDQLDHFNQELLAKLLTKPESILNTLDKILTSLRQPVKNT